YGQEEVDFVDEEEQFDKEELEVKPFLDTQWTQVFAVDNIDSGSSAENEENEEEHSGI
ncbi:hypothetical protein HK098_006296, partial [Nowakowskiella sp. JEL0407]